MRYYVQVTHDTYPNVDEKISSFASCRGNIITAVRDMGSELVGADNESAAKMLQDLIAEIDKGNDGMFNNLYGTQADQQWSKGRETAEEFAKWGVSLERALANGVKMPFTDYQSFCGWQLRDRIRETAVRFFLYYKAGYKVTFEW